MFNKEIGKKTVSHFYSNDCKEEKNPLSATIILYIRATTEKIEFTGPVIYEEKVATSV